LAKEGSFDWIASFDQLKPYLDDALHTVCTRREISKKPGDLRVLVLGCGTSTLSNCLFQHYDFLTVVSIDNDKGCIEHMRKQYTGNDRLLWFTYDIIEDIFKPQGNLLDESQSFDLVIDKGTLDAILVEGSAIHMYYEVNRFLRIDGVYFMCSIHSRELMESLFRIPSLHFSTNCYDIPISSLQNGCICINIKVFHESFMDLKVLKDQEDAVMDGFYKNRYPLLTETNRFRIQNAYHQYMQDNHIDKGGLSVVEAYNLLFTSDEQSTYSIDLFHEDLVHYFASSTTSSSSCASIPDYLTLQECLTFLEQMQ